MTYGILHGRPALIAFVLDLTVSVQTHVLSHKAHKFIFESVQTTSSCPIALGTVEFQLLVP